jgi:hypothetical protein
LLAKIDALFVTAHLTATCCLCFLFQLASGAYVFSAQLALIIIGINLYLKGTMRYVMWQWK